MFGFAGRPWQTIGTVKSIEKNVPALMAILTSLFGYGVKKKKYYKVTENAFLKKATLLMHCAQYNPATFHAEALCNNTDYPDIKHKVQKKKKCMYNLQCTIIKR